jgi:ATP-dependent RNA helicase MSS116
MDKVKKCYQCNQAGHLKRDCPLNPVKGAEAKHPPLPGPPAAGSGDGAAAGGKKRKRNAPKKKSVTPVKAGARDDIDAMDEEEDGDDAPSVTFSTGKDLLSALQKGGEGKGSATAAPPAPLLPKPVSSGTSSSVSTFMTSDRFASLTINKEVLRAIATVMKYEFMTKVQSASLPSILKGMDALVKAKTGTGKTLAFLIPSIELLLKTPRCNPAEISCLVISPTRELATQIADEAKVLLSFLPHLKVCSITGGTNINGDKKAFQQPISFLVATPGRLIDHLQNTPDFASRISLSRILILDEADQLLDMGFKMEIEKILSFLPAKEARQTLLFSATIPSAIKGIAAAALRKGHAFIDTVGDEEEQTHVHVKQEIVIARLEETMAAIYAVLRREMMYPDYKIIVFFTTARVTGFFANLFQQMKLNVLEIHSRKSQSVRTKTSAVFKESTNVILFSSDVSARGMDYPDVTFVCQVGLTEKSQYVHRLGRTARAGKEGGGMILLQPFEEMSMRKELSDFDLHHTTMEALNTASYLKPCADVAASVERNGSLKAGAEQAYQAYLGFYNSNLRKLGWTKEHLVQEAALFAKSIGLKETPFLLKKTVGKMGLKGVPGLRVQ